MFIARPLACHTHCSSRANKLRSSGAHKPRAKHSKAGRSRANKTFESSKSRVNKNQNVRKRQNQERTECQLTSHGWPFKIVRCDDALRRTLVTWSNKCQKLMDFYYPIKILHITLVETNSACRVLKGGRGAKPRNIWYFYLNKCPRIAYWPIFQWN